MRALCAISAFAVVAAARHAAGHRATGGAEIFIPSTDPAVTTVGRTIRNGDGSQTFDWEGTNFALTVNGSSYVRAVMCVCRA